MIDTETYLTHIFSVVWIISKLNFHYFNTIFCKNSILPHSSHKEHGIISKLNIHHVNTYFGELQFSSWHLKVLLNIYQNCLMWEHCHYHKSQFWLRVKYNFAINDSGCHRRSLSSGRNILEHQAVTSPAYHREMCSEIKWRPAVLCHCDIDKPESKPQISKRL